VAEFDGRLRFEIAAHAASLGVWHWDLQTGVFYYSERAKQICGFEVGGEVTFEHVRSVTHTDDYPWTTTLAARSFDPADRAEEPYRYRILRADTGELRWVTAPPSRAWMKGTLPRCWGREDRRHDDRSHRATPWILPFGPAVFFGQLGAQIGEVEKRLARVPLLPHEDQRYLRREQIYRCQSPQCGV
jgi:hypothetical protein